MNPELRPSPWQGAGGRRLLSPSWFRAPTFHFWLNFNSCWTSSGPLRRQNTSNCERHDCFSIMDSSIVHFPFEIDIICWKTFSRKFASIAVLILFVLFFIIRCSVCLGFAILHSTNAVLLLLTIQNLYRVSIHTQGVIDVSKNYLNLIDYQVVNSSFLHRNSVRKVTDLTSYLSLITNMYLFIQ